MPNLFSCIPISRSSVASRSLPTLIPYLFPLLFYPSLPFPKEVNKKLSFHEQNALSMIKTCERNTANISPTVFFYTPV